MSLARNDSPALRFVLRIVSVFVFGLLIWPSLTTAAVQKSKSASSSSQPPGGSLLVGTVASEVGTTAAIPLFYDPGKSAHAQSLHVVLDFVSNSVKFARAEKGVASEGLQLEVKADAVELPPDDKKIIHTRLTVDVAISGSDPKKSLQEGLLAILNFTIPENAKPFSISLNPISISAQDVSKKQLEAAAEPGKVIVSIPDAPLAGCFFFNH